MKDVARDQNLKDELDGKLIPLPLPAPSSKGLGDSSGTEKSEEAPLRLELEEDSERKSALMMRIEASRHSGPIPAPRILKAYDLIDPGLAREIVNMAKDQQQHRMVLEKATILGAGKRAWAGLGCAFALSCLSIGGSVYLIDKGHDVAGAALGTTSLASLVGVFVYGTQQRREERSEKQKNLLNKFPDESSD